MQCKQRRRAQSLFGFFFIKKGICYYPVICLSLSLLTADWMWSAVYFMNIQRGEGETLEGNNQSLWWVLSSVRGWTEHHHLHQHAWCLYNSNAKVNSLLPSVTTQPLPLHQCHHDESLSVYCVETTKTLISDGCPDMTTEISLTLNLTTGESCGDVTVLNRQ